METEKLLSMMFLSSNTFVNKKTGVLKILWPVNVCERGGGVPLGKMSRRPQK